MKHCKRWVFGMASLCAAVAAQASGSALSASSEGGSASVGSVSTSVERSSASSSRGKDVAAGEYRVIDIAAAAEKPGQVRLKLQAMAAETDAGDVLLLLPQTAADRGQVRVGQMVLVQARPYGLEFAQADTQRAFFLVLHDSWYRELQTKALSL
jgi:hypothetical protein